MLTQGVIDGRSCCSCEAPASDRNLEKCRISVLASIILIKASFPAGGAGKICT